MKTGFALAALLTIVPVLAGGAAGHPLPLMEVSCGGVAPTATDCTTGSHPFFGLTFSISCGFADDYVGTVESRVVYAGGHRGLLCTRLADGTVFSGQSGAGPDPTPFTPFDHVCTSVDTDTGLPGGIGAWSCSVKH